ncbi:hypothetical protein [Nonomuraea sp. NPDC050202]|uniref:hypothetical protein n=1 Tax=Nonomuraea sp. NPDC050202 TaxID=3155035 RepID=UPI0033E6CEEE
MASSGRRRRAVRVGVAPTLAVAAVSLPDHGFFGPEVADLAAQEVVETGSATRAALLEARRVFGLPAGTGARAALRR